MRKSLINFTSPRGKIHILHKTMILTLCLSLTGCRTVVASDEKAETAVEFSQISSFREYEWGTSIDTIKEKEIAPDMKEILDYSIESESDLVCLTIEDGHVDKYDAKIGYVFSSDSLVAGAYDLDVNEENYEDICNGISEKYGEPAIQKDSTGWGDCSIWIDDDGNFISVSGILGIMYVQSGNPFVDMQAESFDRFHEIDLLKELGKAGDGYVGY